MYLGMCVCLLFCICTCIQINIMARSVCEYVRSLGTVVTASCELPNVYTKEPNPFFFFFFNRVFIM